MSKAGRERFVAVVFFLLLVAVAETQAGNPPGTWGPLGPSADERFDAEVDVGVPYRPVLAGVTAVVPSRGLPAELGIRQANNNLSIAMFEGRLFLAFRTAPTHFASPEARLILLSSPDLGGTWRYEASFFTGRDLREPLLLDVGGRLRFYFVELGDRMYAFEPLALWRSARCGEGCWTPAEKWGDTEEVAWDFKVRGGRAFMTSYRGKHYDVQTKPIDVRFRTSTDGLQWEDVGPAAVYRGGATEASFEFDRDGALWAITRNEDGDASGFGSHVARAGPGRLGDWQFPARSNPLRFDSPRTFRHGKDIYLVARRDLGSPPGDRFPSIGGEMRKLLIWTSYSLGSKRTALYRLDPVARRFEHVFDLPSAGDTAFPSVARLSAHEFLIANYSSAFEHEGRSWLWGQLNGTGIYFARLRFEPSGAGTVTPLGATAVSRPLFDEDWPVGDGRARGRAGLGVLSIGALVFTRQRLRRLARAA